MVEVVGLRKRSEGDPDDGALLLAPELDDPPTVVPLLRRPRWLNSSRDECQRLDLKSSLGQLVDWAALSLARPASE